MVRMSLTAKRKVNEVKYSVVIVTYNRLDLLKECIQAVFNQSLKFDDVIIVDNASSDGTIDFLHQYDDLFHIIYEKINGGGAKGFKDGIEFVINRLDTDWILVIDDDAILDSEYLKDLNSFIINNPDYKAVAGSVLTEGKVDVTHRKRLKSGLTFSIVPVGLGDYKKDYFECDFASFCGLMVSAKLVKEVGLPKEEYFIWYDDSEYSLRIRTKTKIANVNGAWLNHKTKKSIQNNRLNWKGYYGIRNMGDIIHIYGKTSQYRLYRTRVKIALIKNWLMYFLKKEESYKFNFDLYRDALKDMKNRVFGFNIKYHP